MNFDIVQFLSNTPEWFIAMWAALGIGSLWLLVTYFAGEDE